MTILESGAGSDALAINVAPFGVSDSGAGTDNTGIAVTLALNDAAAANDALLASVLAVVTDVAAGSDLLGSVTVNVPVVDVGQAADVLALAAELAVADSGAGVDVVVTRSACASCRSFSSCCAVRCSSPGRRAHSGLDGQCARPASSARSAQKRSDGQRGP